MQEQEKMLNGDWYLGFDEELVSQREQAKDLCFLFNQTRPSDRNKRLQILKQLIGNLGENSWIESDFYCDYGSHITIGNNFYANHHCIILDPAPVTIGNQVLLGPNVGLYTAGHPLDRQARVKGYEYAKPISIGNDVWIGGHVCIMGGVTIGSHVVIGAGSVVTKSIPDNVLAYGNPCKVMKII
ncbi:MAG: sugar O-acetyltransferase [Clostridia bacterium]